MKNMRTPRDSSIQAQRRRALTWTPSPTTGNSAQDDLGSTMLVTSWMTTSSYGNSSSDSASSSSDSGRGGGE